MAKQTCEFCGKEGIDGRHINLCSKNPKNMPDKVVEPVIGESVPPHIEPSSEVKTLNCPSCGEDAVMMNATDYRCPNCGDRELKRGK